MRKFSYAISAFVLTACGGGGGSNTPSVAVNSIPAIAPAVVDQPYFTEVANAFSDPKQHSWFSNITKLFPNNVDHLGNVNSVLATDLNNDGRNEFIMVIYKGPAHGNVGTYASDPCRSTTVIYTYRDNKFIDVSDTYLEANRDFKACITDSNPAVIDINNDGKKDFFFSANQEDGRRPDLGSEMTSPLVGWVSQPNGKYKIVNFAPNKWYHSIGSGIDSSGNTFVTGAGYPNDQVQNNRYIWNGREMQTIYDQYFPDISPNSFVFLSREGNASDLLIQHTWSKQMGAEGYYKENSIWYKTNMVGPSVTEIGEETFQVWSGDKRKVTVLKIEGHHVVGTGGGSQLDSLTECKLDKNQKPVAVGTYSLGIIPTYVPGEVIKEQNTKVIIMPVSFDVRDKKLTMTKLNIIGENDFSPGKIQCLDANKDGYDDIVLSLGNDKNLRHQRIYINQKDGTFKKLEVSNMVLHDKVRLYFSHMADFDNDGIIDIIAFPGNYYNDASYAGAIKFYRGTKAIQ
jgi:hypothetical protein